MTHIGNPTGKGGFKERPEDINKGGRTKKYLTLLLEQIGEETEPKSGKQFKELIARRTWIDAINGNPQARKEIFDRIEGLPTQSMKLFGDEDNPIKIDVISTLKKIYGRRSTNGVRKVSTKGS